MKRTLLIVGSGFIAAELARTAQREWGWSVEVLFRNYRNPALGEVPNFPLPSGMDELVRLLDQVRPTDVVIATGSSFVPEINRDVEKALDQHLNGTLMILDALTRLKQPLRGRVLLIGSASEYGEFSESPVDERHPALPRDHYGLIKLSLRHLGLHFHRVHGLPVVHLRQFNVTGPGQDGRFVLPSICRQIAQGALASGSGGVVRVVAGNTSVRRDFLAIADVCRAYRTLMLHGEPGDVYNICSGQAHQISALIAMAAEVAGVRAEIEVSSQLVRENDKAQAVILGDPSRLRSLGWAPLVPMRELLAQMIERLTPVAGEGAMPAGKQR
ncbi:GDP-mannose 4,6-dehydratase [Castellaniella sp. MT123]|uniref:NAD-dependent epimerase/dehydratase family protein n=1 Tax=Castellaniella sp. MT123 TaxID=3140381 RepID=UPI0031F3994D